MKAVHVELADGSVLVDRPMTKAELWAFYDANPRRDWAGVVVHWEDGTKTRPFRNVITDPRDLHG